jgi:hypothetical protein
VRDARGVAGGKQHHVGGKRFTGSNAHDVPDADALPFLGLELGVGARHEHSGEAVVLLAVGAVAAEVLVGVLDGGDEEHEGEREHGGAAAEDGDLGELVEHGDDEEVDVGQPAELLEEVAREEGEKRVLCGPDGVPRERLQRRGVPYGDGAGFGVLPLPLRRRGGVGGVAAAGGAERVGDLDGEGERVRAVGRLLLRRRQQRGRRGRVVGGGGALSCSEEWALGRHGGGGFGDCA